MPLLDPILPVVAPGSIVKWGKLYGAAAPLAIAEAAAKAAAPRPRRDEVRGELPGVTKSSW